MAAKELEASEGFGYTKEEKKEQKPKTEESEIGKGWERTRPLIARASFIFSNCLKGRCIQSSLLLTFTYFSDSSSVNNTETGRSYSSSIVHIKF